MAYEWLSDKLADELACEYDVGWSKHGYPLIGAFIGINGRFIDVQDTVYTTSGLNFQEFISMYYLYGSLLEEYVMGLTGYESTCAVSEVFKGLLNGEEFYYYEDNINGWPYTVLRLADNSSRLEFSPFGTINSIINIRELQNKYNGGMSLGDFSYLFTSHLVSNLELLTSNNTYGCKVILQDSSEITVGINLNWTEEEWDQVYGMVGSGLLSAGFTGLAVTWEAGPFGWPVYLLFGGCIAGGFIFTALSHDIDQGFTWAKIKATLGDVTVSYALDNVQG